MAGQKKPNIVMIMADDVGTWNLSAYHRGMMGGSTPTSTGSPARVLCSPTITANSPVLLDGRRSLPAKPPFAQGC
ncbi:MAG: hypothetical protein QOE74_5267 [Mycobacterium sp.]|nr:hypothetical protein [Mycobacterium sp.]